MLKLTASSPLANNKASFLQTNNSAQLPFTLPTKKTNTFNVGFKANPEDNTSRKQRVAQVLNEFKKQIQALQDRDGTSSGAKDKIKENSIGLYNTLDTIFSLHNLNIQLIYQDQSDSAVYIEPISHLGKSIHCLASIATLLGRFPYSFLKIIELNKFTVAKSAQVKKDLHTTVFNNRMMINALFTVEVHNSYEKIEKQFYKVILYHIDKKLPSLYADWPIDFQKLLEPKRGRKDLMGINYEKKLSMSPLPSARSMSPSLLLANKNKLKESPKKSKVNIEEIKAKEILETFSKLMKNPRETLDTNEKAHFLKARLEEIDPIGICQEWWNDLGKNPFVVVETFGGSTDFIVKN